MVPAGAAPFGASGVAPIAGDRLLLVLLKSMPNCDEGLERFLTAARAALLSRLREKSATETDEKSLTFYCALARQYSPTNTSLPIRRTKPMRSSACRSA